MGDNVKKLLALADLTQDGKVKYEKFVDWLCAPEQTNMRKSLTPKRGEVEEVQITITNSAGEVITRVTACLNWEVETLFRAINAVEEVCGRTSQLIYEGTILEPEQPLRSYGIKVDTNLVAFFEDFVTLETLEDTWWLPSWGTMECHILADGMIEYDGVHYDYLDLKPTEDGTTWWQGSDKREYKIDIDLSTIQRLVWHSDKKEGIIIWERFEKGAAQDAMREVKLKFQPCSEDDRLGIRATWDHAGEGKESAMRVLEVLDGQAQVNGVMVGWIFHTVDNESFCEDLLDEMITGEKEFSITFKAPQRDVSVPTLYGVDDGRWF